jgi:hypothetical protein
MNRVEFWSLLDAARRHSGSTKGVPGWLISYLARQSVEEIVGFRDHFRQLSDEAFDGRMWVAVALLRGGCSDDCFDYFRNWLIAKGRETYEAVLRDPDRLADIDTTDGDHGGPALEGMGAVAASAYCEKARDDTAELTDRFIPPTLKNRDFLKLLGDDIRLPGLLPKLFKLREMRRGSSGGRG